MNIILESYYSRINQKSSYTIFKNGKTIYGKLRKCKKESMKEGIFEALYRALIGVKNEVNHEDNLIIVLQNQHVVKWLKDRDGYQGYEYWVEKCLDLLEMLDCKYKIIFKNKYACMNYVIETELEKVTYSTMEDILKEEENSKE